MKRPAGKVTIVSACRNEIRHVAEFVESILSQEMDGLNWEIIIADGMSTDGTKPRIEKYAAANPRLRVIDNPGRIVSTGLNAAIAAAQGNIIIRMDAHTRYAPDYCSQCVATLFETEAENVGGPARTESNGIWQRAVAAAYHSRFSTGGAKFHDPNYEGYVDTVTYGCWKKSTLLQLGGFDEAMIRNQDDELNLRLIRAGGKVWQNPRIQSWYSPRATLGALFNQYFQYGFWKVAVIRKHGSPGSWRHLVPALFALANISLALAVLLTATVGAKTFMVIFAALWAVMVALYSTLALVFSVSAARQNGWDLLPYLPFVFAAYHLSYGAGFLGGLYRFRTAQAASFSNDSVFARITR